MNSNSDINAKIHDARNNTVDTQPSTLALYPELQPCKLVVAAVIRHQPEKSIVSQFCLLAITIFSTYVG